jgi:beta-galactosidase
MNNKEIAVKKINTHYFKQGILFVCLFVAMSNLRAQNNLNFRTRSFDTGWSFKKDTVSSGPEKLSFNDSDWRKIELPHDWSAEDLPNQKVDSIQGPFFRTSPSGPFDGFISSGIAWYRKTFKVNKEDQGKTVYVQFDGVYMNAEVWINGHHLGKQPYGYIPFYYDLAPYLLPAGKDNVIAVKVRNQGANSRWYPGSGIYRHVRLTIVNPVHVDVWGVYVTTPKVSKKSTDVQIATTIKNTANKDAVLTVVTQLIDAKGKIVGTTKNNATVTAGKKSESNQTITISNPKLWSVETPNLYRAKVTVYTNGNIELDQVNQIFGVRDIKIDVKNGLTINSVNVKLKGGCIHHDNGPLGAISVERAEERKIELLKANGYNAIRCSHNPPSQELLEICDRLGMLVIDEAFDAWEVAKFADDYHLYFKEWWNRDLTSMILRDRNHPSIILWSIGNEIRERGDSAGVEIGKMLKKRVNELDNTRMVTEAICDFWDARNTRNWDEHTPEMFGILDVAGYNYMYNKYESDHQKYPNRIMLGTESHPKSVLENWNLIEKHPYLLGDFVWTAIDYRGEAGCGYNAYVDKIPKRFFPKWPWFNANCGDIDFVGNKKPQSYYRDVVWRSSKIELFVHSPVPDGKVEYVNDWGWPDLMKSWNWSGAEGKTLKAYVYTRCQSVKLLLNGKVIGEQKVPENSITVLFDVPYQAGTLVAKGYDNGKEVASTILKTTGVAIAIRLKADRNKIKADRNDLSYVSVEIVDAKGNLVPNAENIEVTYTISGNGELAAVGNGNPVDVSSFQQPKKKVFHGKGLVIIRPKGTSGKILLDAQATGLKGSTLEIITQ